LDALDPEILYEPGGGRDTTSRHARDRGSDRSALPISYVRFLTYLGLESEIAQGPKSARLGPLSADARAEIIELNGAPGLVLTAGGHPVVAILIESDGERIHSVFGVSNPDKLVAIAKARAQSLA
jgi:hypothetical protein